MDLGVSVKQAVKQNSTASSLVNENKRDFGYSLYLVPSQGSIIHSEDRMKDCAGNRMPEWLICHSF